MQRAIVTPPILALSALAELKQWLAITTTNDDAPLTALLRASLETCEAFTGTMPIVTLCEERIAGSCQPQPIATRPVQAIVAVAAIAPDGSRTALSPDAYAAVIDADGGAQITIAMPFDAQRFVVTFTAGLATAWDTLPASLRHGIVRLAAHQHREREGSGADMLPPASVAALWRPWRRLRLT